MTKTNAGMSAFQIWLRSLGPGIITAALVFGPSKITIASKLGAQYGFELLWVIPVAITFMIVFTAMSARIGIATDVSLLTSIGNKWGRRTSIALGIGVFLVTASFQAGNSIGIGIAAGELTHTKPTPWIIIFNLIGINLLFFRAFYKVLEKLMILLILFMLIAFIITFLFIRPDPSAVLPGLVPSIPKGSSGLIVAFIASTFSIVGALYQSYMVQERKRLNPGITQSAKASFTGMIMMGVMGMIVLICGGAILHPAGIKVQNAADMAKGLEPLFGKFAPTFFLSGLFGASFSALVGNASVGGTILGDSMGFGSKLSSGMVKIFIAAVVTIGAAIAIVFGKLPLELIVLAQTVTIFIVPFLAIAMFLVANDKTIMKEYANRTTAKIAGITGIALLTFLGIISLKDMFFK